MIRGRAVDTRPGLIDRTRILALFVLALPGLLLSGAVHLCICLGALAAGSGSCANAAPDCCARFEPGTAAEDAAECGDCCIAIDVEGGLPMAPRPESDPGIEFVAFAPAVGPVVAPPWTAEQRGPPARAATRLPRAPGRAPTPLRI